VSLTSCGRVLIASVQAITPASVSVLLHCTLPSSIDPFTVQWDADANDPQTGGVQKWKQQWTQSVTLASRLQYIRLWTQVVVLYRIGTIWISWISCCPVGYRTAGRELESVFDPLVWWRQIDQSSVFTRQKNYCVQRVLAIAILSVRLSHGWISQKRCKLGLSNLHRRLPGRP